MAPRRRRSGRGILVGAIAALVVVMVGTAITLWATRSTDAGTPSASTVEGDQLISSGWGTTCTIDDGSLYCSGNNGFGQIGDGTTLSRNSPVKVAGLSGVTAVAADITTCAVANGDVYCWGNNENGQIGDGTTTNRPTPFHVPGISKATSVSAVESTVCAVADGSAYCWGSNKYGQLGDGTKTDRQTPTKVLGLAKVTTIVTHGSVTCAVADYTSYCWGAYFSGNTVIDQSPNSDWTKPTALSGLPRTMSVSTAGNTTCAVSTEGAVFCWGRNTWGEVGDGTTTERFTPVQVQGLPPASQVFTSGATTCAASTEGLYCWGFNSDGQIGDGSTTNRLTPTRAQQLTDVTSVSIGGYTTGPEHGTDSNTCAVASGISYCWGAGYAGQLGTGSTASSVTPQRVALP